MFEIHELSSLEDLPDISGRNVLLRADLNVPLTHEQGEPAAVGQAAQNEWRVADDFRIDASLPTLEWLLDKGANVTVCSHLGRPKGKFDPDLSMKPVTERLNYLLRRDGVSDELISRVNVMENLRFDPGEEQNDPAFVDKLIDGQDFYVNDAFGAAHRAHASVVGPPMKLPSVAGRLLFREVEVLSGLLESPAEPFVLVLGGAKVSDKLKLLDMLGAKADVLLIGGGMAFTFFLAKGVGIGDSLAEPLLVSECENIYKHLQDAGVQVLLPVDIVIVGPGDEVELVDVDGNMGESGGSIPPGWKGMDIGQKTSLAYAKVLQKAGTVFWNGPMGVFEDTRFAPGTVAIAKAVADSLGVTIVGGGDSARALHSLGLADKVDHLSTGGGACLEFLEKGDLPGLEKLRK
ncbi:MAG: phosphoglycerate kinase [Actinobacteria bacterium]|nr:phosphoglycerate kinase [Actinomycetota bacterium]MCL6104468.1 phosphoglycerate kinase [Actinomycetota bacterium]